MYAAVNLKRNLRSMYCTIEANNGHEASRGLFATAELLVSIDAVAWSGFFARMDTACAFTKSGRNYLNFYNTLTLSLLNRQ